MIHPTNFNVWFMRIGPDSKILLYINVLGDTLSQNALAFLRSIISRTYEYSDKNIELSIYKNRQDYHNINLDSPSTPRDSKSDIRVGFLDRTRTYGSSSDIICVVFAHYAHDITNKNFGDRSFFPMHGFNIDSIGFFWSIRIYHRPRRPAPMFSFESRASEAMRNTIARHHSYTDIMPGPGGGEEECPNNSRPGIF